MMQSTLRTRLLFCCLIVFVVVSGNFLPDVQANPNPQLPQEDPESEARTDSLGDPLPEDALLRLGTKRFQHPSGVDEMAISNDGKVIATMSGSEYVVAWDAENGKELWRKRLDNEHLNAAYGIRPLTVCPTDGRFVIPGRSQLFYFTPETGEVETVEATDVTAGMIKCVEFRRDGGAMILGGQERLIVRKTDGEDVAIVENGPMLRDAALEDDRLAFEGGFSYGRFAPDNQIYAVLNSEMPRTLQMFDLEPAKEWLIDCESRIVRAEFSPDSKTIVTTERDNTARLYDVQTGERIWEFKIEPVPNAECYTSCVAFSPDGSKIAVGAPNGPDETIRIIDAANGNELHKLEGGGWKPWAVVFAKDGTSVYSTGWGGTITRWNVETGERYDAPGGIRAGSVCAVCPDGEHVAYADMSGNIRIASIENGATIRKYNEGDIEWGQAAFSSDGSLLVAGGASPDHLHLFAWETGDGERVREWKWEIGRDPHANIEALCISKNGKRVGAVSFRQNKGYIWDLESGEQTCAVSHGSVYGMDIDEDGTNFITVGWDKYIRCWNADTGDETKSMKVVVKSNPDRDDDTRMYGIKLSKNGETIAVNDMTGCVRLFDRELNQLTSISGCPSHFGSLDISSNGLWIGFGTSSNEVKVLDVATGKHAWKAKGHEEYLYTVEFGADDRTLLSGAGDSCCYLWDLVDNEEFDKLDPEIKYEFLVSDDGPGAFAAFNSLSVDPAGTTQLLTTKITDIVEMEVDERELLKQVISLGADDEQRVNDARNKLYDWGPAVYDRLQSIVDDEEFDPDKAVLVRKMLRDIPLHFRRAAILLAELDNPDVDGLLERLAAKADSELMTSMIEEAISHRKYFFKK